MASTKVQEDFITQIGQYVKDGGVGNRTALKPEDVKTALATSLVAYNHLRPREVVVDLDTDGTGVIALADLEGFDYDFNAELQIEFPISDKGEPNLLDPREWGIYNTPQGRVIRLHELRPNGTANLRVTFKTKHVIDERRHEQTDTADPPVAITTTVPDDDFAAICKKGASESFKMLAAYFNQTGEGQFVNADQSFVRSKSSEYRTQSEKAEKDWLQLMGIGNEKDNETAPASVNKNWDTRSSLGTDRVTHPRRRR